MNQDDLLALIDQIYEAATDTDRWPVVLQTIADAFTAGEASLSAVSPRAVPWLMAPRTDPEYLQSYGAHYHPLNLFWHEMTRVPIGTAITDRMVLSKQTLHSSPFFNEWSRPQKYLSVMGATLLADDDWRVEFVVPGKHEFGPAHLKLYNALGPHLRRAVQLGHRLRKAEIDRACSLAALDSLGQGVLVVDAKAHILFANQAADRALRHLKIADGILCSNSPIETVALHSAIAAGAEDNLNAVGDNISISRGPHRASLSLLVVPFRSQNEWISRQLGAKVIFITNPDDTIIRDGKHLRQQFGLTPAEAALVQLMLDGGSMQAIADRLGIKISTARTHLHRILAKTGTRNQADLMRLLLIPRQDIRRNGGRT
jgi:DNA-binding CsgD family transcriptional regulator/PAS domain-containing protein